jgi:hypothetical protein
MEFAKRIRILRLVLVLIGLIFIFGIYPFTILWPQGWAWHLTGVSLYLQMIIGIYVTLGVFLILAAFHPLENLSLIWFTVWSSFVHGGIMLIQSIYYPEHLGHLLGDVPALFLCAIVLCLLTPRAKQLKNNSSKIEGV